MSLNFSPEQECAVATLNLFNNSTAWRNAEEALETQMIDRILSDAEGCAAKNDVIENSLCIIDESDAAFNDTTTAYTNACQSAGGIVLVEPRVDVTCLLANKTTTTTTTTTNTIDVMDAATQRLALSFQNIDICADKDACTADMVDFLFLNKGRDILEALFAAQVDNDEETFWICYEVDDCSFVRSSPGAPEVPLAQLPGCPTLAPTLSPTTATATGSGAVGTTTTTSSSITTWITMVSTMVWAVRAWGRS